MKLRFIGRFFILLLFLTGFFSGYGESVGPPDNSYFFSTSPYLSRQTIGSIVVSPVEVFRGDLVKVSVIGAKEEIGYLEASVLSDETGFDIGDSERIFKNSRLKSLGFTIGNNRWIILLAVPSYFKSGRYKLAVRGGIGGEEFLYIRAFKIKPKKFRFERLKLNEYLSELKRSKNPLIKKQTKELVKLLYTFDRSKLFLSKGCILPLKPPGESESLRVTSYFGDRREYDYLDGGVEHSIHNGIDFGVPVGTPVCACGRGEVVFSDNRIITGKSIILEHLPGVYSIYYHLSKLVVKRGDTVERGEVIGYSGKSGFATGPHLHWEIRVSGVAVNPECFLGENIIDKKIFIGIINKPIK